MTDACRLVQLTSTDDLRESDRIASLLSGAETGLKGFVEQAQLGYPADYRLAFRELGLSIGIHAIARIQKIICSHLTKFSNRHELSSRLSTLQPYLPLADNIENFWLQPANQQSNTWTSHRDINGIMLATSLAPDGFLILQ